MSRPRKNRLDLPRRVYERRGTYFFVAANGKWHRLGTKLADALVRYAELIEPTGRVTTMRAVFDRYEREVVPKKAPRTRADNERELGLLRKAFGHMRPDDVTPRDVYAYMDARKAPVRAKRERALLSHVFGYAIEWGHASDNPCRLVRSRHKEKPRARYVTDAEFWAVHDRAPEVVRLAMLLAWITGLRQGDILRLKLSDFTKDGLVVQTGKTGKRIVYEWTPALRDVVKRAKKLRKKNVVAMHLLIGRSAQPYTASGFASLWQRVQRKATDDEAIAERFTFHDLRAKAGSDSEDERLLGHVSAATLRRHYQRKPYRVTPIAPRILEPD